MKGDVVVDAHTLVGVVDEVIGPDLKLVRPPGRQSWTASAVLARYASEEEAATIRGEVIVRIIGGSERPLLPRRKD
ncbi:hypothetical protein [Streptomyces sp. NPDC003952]